MILGFKTHFPWKEETFFWQKIIASVPVDPANPQGSPGNMFQMYQPKLHTMRQGQRIRRGTWLHMATGVRTSKYYQFNKGIEKLAKCRGIQRLDLTFRSKDVIALYIDKELKYCRNRDHVFEIEPGWLNTFAINDGFTGVEQFFRGVKAIYKKGIRNGQLIHWTDHRY